MCASQKSFPKTQKTVANGYPKQAIQYLALVHQTICINLGLRTIVVAAAGRCAWLSVGFSAKFLHKNMAKMRTAWIRFLISRLIKCFNIFIGLGEPHNFLTKWYFISTPQLIKIIKILLFTHYMSTYCHWICGNQSTVIGMDASILKRRRILFIQYVILTLASRVG